MSKPAHKQDNPAHMPGQIKNDVTLGDYIERKSKSMEKRLDIQTKKLTFDEWWRDFSHRYSLDDADSLVSDFEQCWLYAQENK